MLGGPGLSLSHGMQLFGQWDPCMWKRRSAQIQFTPAEPMGNEGDPFWATESLEA